MTGIVLTAFLSAVLVCASSQTLWAQTPSQEVVSLSDSIGAEIDKSERETYHLFPDIKDFLSARIVRLPHSKYRLEYTCGHARRRSHKSKGISSDALELTKLHVRLLENYYRTTRSKAIDGNQEAEVVYRLALKYALQARYDISSSLFNDLVQDYPESRRAQEVKQSYGDIVQLSESRKALFRKGSLFDRSGRTDVLVFSGYYGLWLGVATPIALNAESPQAYAAGLMLGGPVAVAIASTLTKEADISRGRASMISLGGHLGTWQGLGWAAIADMDGNDAVGVGELAGLAGIGASAALSSAIDFSEGHAALTGSGMSWGAWFGLVAGTMADHDGNDLLRDMLIGSDALVLGAGIAFRNVRASRARVRLINLAGVIGTVFGLGLDLLAEVDDGAAAMAIAGLGSAAGLAAGASLTKDYDRGKELSLISPDRLRFRYASKKQEQSWSVSPGLAFHQDLSGDGGPTPIVGLQLNF